MTFENLMNSISEEQKSDILENACIYEYIFFDISVFNVGAVITLKFCEDFPEFEEDGYSCVLYAEECVNFIHAEKCI